VTILVFLKQKYNFAICIETVMLKDWAKGIQLLVVVFSFICHAAQPGVSEINFSIFDSKDTA